MPNVMVALPNKGGALCSTPHFIWLTPITRLPCSNAAKTRNPLKLPGGPKFTILWGHVEEILLLNKFFFPIVDTCLICEDIALSLIHI